MDELQPPPTSAAGGDRGTRLDSWKEIAAYLGRGVTTVQRWEVDEALPVHRLPHARRGSVFAFTGELDAWRMNRAHPPGMGAREPHPASAEAGGEGSPVRAWRSTTVTRATAAGVLVGVLGLLVLVLALRRSSSRAMESSPAEWSSPQARPLAVDAASELQPDISADGAQVIFRWQRRDAPGLYVKTVGGGAPQPLRIDMAATRFNPISPKWSPQGDLVAFLSREPGGAPDVRGLFLVSARGGSARRLALIAGIGVCWSPDGRTIAFADRNSTSEPFSIFALTIDTGRRDRLTTPPLGAFGDTHCAFSPDGRRLAVSRYFNRYQSDLVIVGLGDPQGAAIERLTYDSSGIEGVEWTPDGEAIVFGSHNGLWSIAVEARPGQKPRQIAAAGMYPAFSQPVAGGLARLVFEHTVRDVNIWRWAAGAGAGSTVRIPGSTLWEDHPAISPDGRHIAFASNRTGANEIWTANIDGSDARQLTFHEGPVVISPQWSPDGSSIAFSSQVGGNRDIYVIRRDGSGSQRLTSEPSQEDNPSWSRDGRWIYFRSDRSGVGQLWKMSPAGGTAIRMTAGEASQGFESPDGTILYFVRGMNVPGVWSVPVSGGNESFVLDGAREALWGVADRGIVFVSRERSADGAVALFYDFKTRTVTSLATLPQPMTGFAVSRDARSILWTRTDTYQSDLMLIDAWAPRARATP
jgi:Tol biopolymer transport system component